jgi:FkbM family methyltransferase
MIASIRRRFQKIRSHRNPLRFLASRILYYLGLFERKPLRGRALRVSGLDDCRILMSPTSLIPYLWADERDYEEEIQVIRACLSPGDCFVDVGANVGVLTIAGALQVGSKGRVIAVEAHPVTYTYLLENLAANAMDWVQTFNCAIGEIEGKILFTDSRFDSGNHIATSGDGIEISMKRLDQLLTNDVAIKLLKVDVEGFEYAVLKGSERTLKNIECIWFESYEENYSRYGYKLSAVWELLSEYGFQLYRLESGIMKSLPKGHRSVACENLLAAKDSRSLALRLKEFWPS